MSITFNFKIQDYYDSGQIKQSDVEILREHLKNEKMPYESDEMIGVFLMACSGDLEAAKKYSMLHYHGRKDVPEIFSERNIQNEVFKKEWDVVQVGVLPERTDEGYAVIIVRFQDPVTSHFHMDIACKLILMCVDSILCEEPVKGFLIIVDLEKMGLMHMTRLKLGILKRIFKWVSEGLLINLKGVHYINGGFVLDKLFKLFKMICKPELLNLFLYHPINMDWNEFYTNTIPKKCLPSDYGGDCESVEELHKKLWTKLQDLKLFFEQEGQSRALFEQIKE